MALVGTHRSQRTSSLEWERAGTCGGVEATGDHRKPTLGGLPDQVTYKPKSRGQVRISQATHFEQGRESVFQDKGALHRSLAGQHLEQG